MALARTIIIFSGFVGIGMLLGATVYAVEPMELELGGISLGPVTVNVTIKPGESFEQVFTLQNRTYGTIRAEPYLQDFYIKNNQWHMVENPDPRWSPMTWATILSAPENLDEMEQGEVVVRFDVPLNAETGEHVTYFSVRFIPADTDSKIPETTGITAISEIRAPVFVRVTDLLGNLDITQGWLPGKIGTNFWNINQPVFTVSAVNTGNVHLKVRGKIIINDLLRNQKTELDLPRYIILPGVEREMTLRWAEAPFIGYFRGNVELTYDDITFEKREFHFIIAPLLTMAGTLLIIVGTILAVVLYIRKLQKRLAAAERRLLNKPAG